MNPKVIYITTIPMTLQLFLRGHIEYIQKHGFTVFTISAPDSESNTFTNGEQMRMFFVPMSRSVSPVEDFAAIIKMYRIFKDIKPQIVNSSTGKAGPLGLLAALLAGIPIRIYTLRGMMLDRGKGILKPIFWVVEYFTCLIATKVISVSPSLAKRMIGNHLCKPDKIKVLGSGSSNGVDSETRFNPELISEDEKINLRNTLRLGAGDFVIGFVGRIVKGKGIPELLNIWEILSSKGSDLKLLIIGPFESEDQISEAAKQAIRENPRITHLDFAPNSQMPVLYSIMNLLLLPSHSEGFPNVVLEAASMAKPAIVSNRTGCIDAVQHGKTGFIAPLEDSAKFVE